MTNAVYLLNNRGQNAPPGALDAAPVLSQTAQTATDATTGGDHTLTVTAGKAYLVAATQLFVFGVADVTTAGNVRWVCPANGAAVIHMPLGYTALHYQSLTNAGIVYLIELVE